jgi:hypothetical protein
MTEEYNDASSSKFISNSIQPFIAPSEEKKSAQRRKLPESNYIRALIPALVPLPAVPPAL